MKRRYSKKPTKQKEIALDRIMTLFDEARQMFKKDKELANRYVNMARELSMKYKVPIPSRLKKQFCKHCKHFLFPPINCRVRLQKSKVVYSCLDCKHYMRFPYIREKKARKKK